MILGFPFLHRFGGRLLCASLALAGALAVLGATPAAPAPKAPLPENDVKAALIFNLVEFVEWPAEAFGDPKAPIVVGVFGQDAFANVLDDFLHGESVKGHPFVVTRVQNADAAKACSVLFISGKDDRSESALLSALKGRAILTIGDRDRFLARGGMIYLFRNEYEQPRIRINKLSLLRACGLEPSSKLLRVAEITPED